MAKLSDLRLYCSQQEALFAECYVSNWEKAESAVKAGYSADSASHIASHLLAKRRVQNYIAALIERKRKELAPTVERLKLEVSDLAFSDITELYDKLSNGGLISDIECDNLKRLPRRLRACIESIVPTKYGFKIRFYNKIAALEMLAKHLGFYEKDNLQKPTSTGVAFYIPDNGRPMPPDPERETTAGPTH